MIAVRISYVFVTPATRSGATRISNTNAVVRFGIKLIRFCRFGYFSDFDAKPTSEKRQDVRIDLVTFVSLVNSA